MSVHLSQFSSAEFQRIISNYVRLLVTFGSGILIIRCIAEIGAAALILYLLILSGTGFAQAFKIIVQESVIPVLGMSLDSDSGRPFGGVYWFSATLGLAAGGLALVIYFIIWCLRDLLDFGEISGVAFAIALISATVRTIVSSVASTPLNAILVSGRIVSYNVILASERLVDLFAVLVVLWAFNSADMTTQITLFFILSAVLYIIVQVVCYIYAQSVDFRFRILPARLDAKDRKWVSKIFGWNTAIVVAFIFYLRFGTFLINGTYGADPTLVLGVVFLLIGYQRQISMGLVIGLDATVSRLVGGGLPEGREQVHTLLIRSTYIQGVFSMVSLALLFLFVEPLLVLWFGDSLSDSNWDTTQAAMLFRVMALGVLARSISEPWMKFLNGQGLVGNYAGYVFSAAILNALVITIVATSSGWSAYLVMLSIAVCFSFFYVTVHLVVVPIKLADSLNIKGGAIYSPLMLPIVVILVMMFFSFFVQAGVGGITGVVVIVLSLGLTGGVLLSPRVLNGAVSVK